MEIKIYKTDEISDDLWTQIVAGYNQSFDGHSTNKDKLIESYSSNHFGFSYHALCFENDKVIGFNSIIPSYYIYKKTDRIILGLSGTTFVLKQYRKDIFIFQDMYNSLKEYCRTQNIVAFLGVPNANSYQYSIKFLKCIEITKLSYYILPLNLFKILGHNKKSKFNCISYFFLYFWVLINKVISYFLNTKEIIKNFRIEYDNNYYNKRFKATRYKTVNINCISFSYTITDEDGTKVAYLMDFRENSVKSNKALTKAVNYILQHEKIDAIMYIGLLNFVQGVLFKVPVKYEPKTLPLTYNLLIEKADIIQNIGLANDWDFSLMNLDIR